MVGETLYIYDRYSKQRTWIEVLVTGETRASWLTRHYKIDKKTMHTRGDYACPVYTTAQQAGVEWATVHRREIIAKIERADVTTLRKVGAIVGIE